MNEESISQTLKRSEFMRKLLTDPEFRTWRKVVVFVIGITLLIIGVIMIILPGPALVVIPASLAILSTEFLWARRWLNKLKEQTGIVTKQFSFLRKKTKN